MKKKQFYLTIYISPAGAKHTTFRLTNKKPKARDVARGEGNCLIFRLVEFMEGFGYSTYNYDTVLYTFEFRDYDKTFIVKGDGLNFNQAVCNCFVELGLKILFKY